MAAPLEFPFAPPTADGALVEVAPGVLWARMPMPMKLDHINVYLLRGDAGWTLVDTGLHTDACKALWERLAVDDRLGGLPFEALICTHMHYDHAGLAHWIGERFGVPLYMTHGEYFAMRGLVKDLSPTLAAPHAEFYRLAGLPPDRLERLLRALRTDPFMPPVPQSYRRLRNGEELAIGARRWRVVVGEGHSPEHACLYSADDRLLLAGDQLLPRISSNVLVTCVEPEADPLRLWLDSLDRLDRLDPETLVLPSHERVFRGVHARTQELRDHHHRQFAALEALIDEQGRCTAFQGMLHLFPRLRNAIDDMLALGETIAHLTWLRHAGRVTRRLDDAGAYSFQRAH